MSTFTPNELTYLVTPPPIEVAGLTKAYGEAGAVRGVWFTVTPIATDVTPAGVRL